MRVRFRAFDKGLWLMGPQERMPAGTLRRATGTHSVKKHVLRSRQGSTLVYNVMAHSLTRFADARFQGVGTQLYRNGGSIYAGLSGSRLRFLRMPPTVGMVDYLFVTGGVAGGVGSLIKVDSAGNVTQWGIDAPTTDPTATDFAAGALGAGTYKYKITFKNSTTGSRSNGNPNEVAVATGAARQNRLTNIPVSLDAQVSAREVWRTVANGVAYFLVATIANNVDTTYDDNTADSGLSSTSLPTNNDPPRARYSRVTGPYYGRAFWAGIDIDGERGRVVFSPAGRPESDDGFIDITNDDDPTQEIVLWNGSLWVFTEGKLFQILGTNEPFTTREVSGAPGTTDADSVCPTPYGIVYKANDSLRLFNGSLSRPLGDDSVGLLFRGEALEGLGPLGTATGHVYARDEYFVSDGVITLAINVIDGTWRNVGVAATALAYEDDTKKLMASFAAKVVLFEEPAVVADDAVAITFEIETPALLSDVMKPGLLQRVYVEANTRGQWLTPYVRIVGKDDDGNDVETVTALPQFRTTLRATQEYPQLRSGRVMSIRLVGALTDQVDIYGIEADIDIGADQVTPTPVVGKQEGVVSVAQAQAAS